MLRFFFQQTREQWQTVFYIIAGFLVFGITFFGIFAKGEVLDWAKEEIEDEEKPAEDEKAEEVKMLENGEPISNGVMV